MGSKEEGESGFGFIMSLRAKILLSLLKANDWF
jgi:hypothetical protein